MAHTDGMKHTPAWKDQEGNRIVFPGRNSIFSEEHQALEKAVGDMIWMMPFGLAPDGILSFTETADGDADIPHIIVKVPMLGHGAVVAGPRLDRAKASP